jgi:hypothetical protein
MIGATENGDLQVGWLWASVIDPYERAVYLDSKAHKKHGYCAMYVLESYKTRNYITKTFDTNPMMYITGSEAVVKKLLFADKADLADRFHLIQPPKSQIGDILKGGSAYTGAGEDLFFDKELEDVDLRGGTLVLFDSVTLLHEVLATKNRNRFEIFRP